MQVWSEIVNQNCLDGCQGNFLDMDTYVMYYNKSIRNNFSLCSVLGVSATDPHKMIFLPEPSSSRTVSASNHYVLDYWENIPCVCRSFLTKCLLLIQGNMVRNY